MGKAVPVREPAALPLVLPPAATRTWESVVSDPTRYFVTSPGTSDERRFLQEEQRTMEVFERSAPSVVHIMPSPPHIDFFPLGGRGSPSAPLAGPIAEVDVQKKVQGKGRGAAGAVCELLVLASV